MTFAPVRGLDAVRNDLRKMPDKVRGTVTAELLSTGFAVRDDAKSLAPVNPKNKGVHLRDIVGAKLSKDGLSMTVGFSAKVIGRRLFRLAGWRAHFTLGGTKGGMILRGRAKGTRIPPQAPNDFLGKAADAHTEEYFRKVGAAVDRVLS